MKRKEAMLKHALWHKERQHEVISTSQPTDESAHSRVTLDMGTDKVGAMMQW